MLYVSCKRITVSVLHPHHLSKWISNPCYYLYLRTRKKTTHKKQINGYTKDKMCHHPTSQVPELQLVRGPLAPKRYLIKALLQYPSAYSSLFIFSLIEIYITLIEGNSNLFGPAWLNSSGDSDGWVWPNLNSIRFKIILTQLKFYIRKFKLDPFVSIFRPEPTPAHIDRPVLV